MDIYKEGLRRKLRFPCRGTIAIQHLFDLTLDNLNQIYQELIAESAAKPKDSLLDTPTQDVELELKIAIVKDVFETLRGEQLEREEEIKKRSRNQMIMAAISRKELNTLDDLSVDDLKALLED